MPNQPPIWAPPLSGRDAALVAGFILHYRQGILWARDTLDLVTPGIFDEWVQAEQRFFKDGERWTRFLLYYTGYDVGKDLMWGTEGPHVGP